MALLQLLAMGTDDGAEMEVSSRKAELAVMLGEGLELFTSGDISCFRQSGRGCRASEAEQWVDRQVEKLMYEC